MSNAAGARGFQRRVQALKATLKGSPYKNHRTVFETGGKLAA